MMTRQLGRILCGRATAAQLILAAVLGAMLGFAGFGHAPGATAVLTLLLVLLNANLPLAAFVGAGATLFSLVLEPVSFATGRLLLDGPTRPLFQALINTRGTALLGLEHYVVTGGLLLGGAGGLVVGVLLARAITRFRRFMGNLEEGSETYRRWADRWWVRALHWALFGGPPKGGYAAAAAQRGKVIRPLGVVAVGLALVLLVLVRFLLAEPIVTAFAQRALERANGATVNLERAELHLGEGRVALHGLAIADPQNLDQDLVRARKVKLDLRSSDLLRKRLTLDRLEMVDGRLSAPRQVRGQRVRPPAEPRKVPPPPEEEEDMKSKTLEDYLAEAEAWKKRLAQVRRWLERFAGASEKPAPETRQERIADRIERDGYAAVTASHLVTGQPTLTVRALHAEGMRAPGLEDETLTLEGAHLSTQPWLLEEPPRLAVRSSGETLRVRVAPGAADETSSRARDEEGRIELAIRNLPGDRVRAALTPSDPPRVRGGTVSARLAGALSMAPSLSMDAPCEVVLRDSTVQIPELGARQVKELTLSLHVRGPLDNPRITLNMRKIAQAFTDAGVDAFADKLKSAAGEARKKQSGPAFEEGARDAFKGLFGGEKNNDK